MAASSLLVAAPAASQSAGSSGVLAPGARFEQWCTPTDPALRELSGLAVIDGTMYGVGDSGTDDTVAVLGGDCSVTSTLSVPVDPYDIEDMGVGPDGRLWLADIGDNNRVRSTVALTSLDPTSGEGNLHRLTYPDDAHDAETLLVQRDGVPLIVTKEILVANGIYRPVGGSALDDLESPGPTPLERVGEVRLGPTPTPGGPVPVGGSTLVTGGAVSADGTVAALRTYTDVYLYSAPDGDLVRAITATTPVRVELPNEPQGEAIAFTPDGDLISGSETAGGPPPPLRILRGANELARSGGQSVNLPSGDPVAVSAEITGSDERPAEQGTDEHRSAGGPTSVLIGGAVVAGLASYALVHRRSRAARRRRAADSGAD
ncbi:hypothetical protein EF834_10550 [Rhodococcus spongiicola]|uniref:Uncharacterized protein n=2 Tax=Rhodococcus spongiicola TaxID=2487352 RepID=A0A3S3ALX7_9NOCA|nr:hypothetical protein EF834_10550 [Rhodococcus spongiicola]